MAAYFYEREQMVKTQLLPRKIHDPEVLQAMRMVPREVFVPTSLSDYAYEDKPLPIEEGQTISQPYIVALMAQALSLSKKSRVLEIGTGSGYAAAILSRIASQVYTVERFVMLAALAQKRFENLGYKNIFATCDDGTKGWPEAAPFDAITVAAGHSIIPKPLLEQLKIGGYLVMPVGSSDSQGLMRIHRVSEMEYVSENLGEVRFVPLVGAQTSQGQS